MSYQGKLSCEQVVEFVGELPECILPSGILLESGQKVLGGDCKDYVTKLFFLYKSGERRFLCFSRSRYVKNSQMPNFLQMIQSLEASTTKRTEPPLEPRRARRQRTRDAARLTSSK